ncbi:MAG: hypothetical protein M1813_009358 [Trichoglossum hirsutum]|nr:MAG: hypothetical protein M1813_009358 [Trichoglossum hirsutum]
MDPADIPVGLCSTCLSITPEALASQEGYLLQGNSQTCALCAVLQENFNEYQRRFRILYVHKEEAEEDMFSKVPPQLLAFYDNKGNMELWSRRPICIMADDDFAVNYGIPAARRSLSSTRPHETFQFIENCIHTCITKHSCSSRLTSSGENHNPSSTNLPNNVTESCGGQSKAHEDSFPARLIDLEAFPGTKTRAVGDLRLVEVVRDCPKYMTLSHYWGGNLEGKTTLLNLSQRLLRFRLQEIPPTFKDTVEITRRLGIRYLWIDALCIIQDSPTDWAEESVKMAEIYSQSFLTIAADKCKDSFGSCFNIASRAQDLGGETECTMVEVPKTLQDGSTSSLLFWLLRDSFQSPDMGPLENSPLNERGWVFQERILSPRTVHFTATQLVWECRGTLLTEDLLPLPSADRRHASFFKEFLGSDPRNIIHWYGEIESAYLPLKFTNPEDRLIAISGIAKMGYLRMSSKIRYLAGLWAETLPYGLSWKLPVENSDLPEAPRRPSWT